MFVYFDGKAPPDPVLRSPSIVVRPLGDGGRRNVVWSERILPDAAREDPVAAGRLKAELQAVLGSNGPSREVLEADAARAKELLSAAVRT